MLSAYETSIGKYRAESERDRSSAESMSLDIGTVRTGKGEFADFPVGPDPESQLHGLPRVPSYRESFY